jgi:hypothetical protein
MLGRCVIDRLHTRGYPAWILSHGGRGVTVRGDLATGMALKTELWRGYMGGLLTSFEEPGLGRSWCKTPLPIDLLLERVR